MSEILTEALPLMVRTTLLLAVAAVTVRIVLWLLQPRSPVVHRLAWCCVLLQGVLLSPWSLDIPWYPTDDRSTEAVRQVSELPALALPTAVGVRSVAPLLVATAERERAWNWQTAAGVCWLAGLLTTLGISLLGYVLLLVSMRRARPARGAWRDEWRALSCSHGVRSEIPLLVHPTVGPLLCRLPRGFAVVVPGALWSQFTVEQRAAILRHELAHYQRGDIWKSLAARLLAVPHWFNPLAWWAVRKFEEGGEWACDQQLADDDPRQVPAFARALLAIIEPDANRAFASAARGAPLAVRLRRLLSFQSSEDSLMKRCLVCAVLMCLLAVGVFRIQLVAREAAQDQEGGFVSAEFGEEAGEFADTLAADSELLKRFQTALRSPAGKIVLQDRASYFAERLREEAQSDALPGYLAQHFVKRGDKYELAEGQDEYRQQFLSATAAFTTDVARIEAVLKELAAQIQGDSETDRLATRFLNHEAAPTMLYVHELQERMRPNEALIQRRLGEIFVANDQGQYVIRAGRRGPAEGFWRQGQQILRGYKNLQTDLAELAAEFAEPDEFNKRAKQRLAEPLFAAFIAAQLLDGDDPDADVTRRIDEFFEEFGNIAVDTADGLAIIEPDQRREVEEALAEYERLKAAVPKLSAPLKAFAENIDATDELERGWQQLLRTDVAALKLAEEFEVGEVDPQQAVRDLLQEVVVESDSGLQVREGREEELTEAIRDMFRTYRMIRRKGRAVDQVAQQLTDPELARAFASTGGKFVVMQAIQRSFSGADFNGLSLWVDEVFQAGDQGWVLREGGEEEIENFLADVENVRAELQKDDF